MAISFDKDKKIFKLDTKESSYVLAIYEEAYLVHLYYGAKLPDDNLMPMLFRGWFDSLSPFNTKVSDRYFSPDVSPMEYPCNGTGDFRLSALSVRGETGASATDIRYVSHKIYGGKSPAEGLPGTFAAEEEAQTLEIETLDAVTGIKAYLIYTVFENFSAMTRSVRIENTADSAAVLERAYSLCADFNTMEFDMVHLYGKWMKENTTVRHPLQHGIQSVQGKRGISGPNHNPFAALVSSDCTEETGEAYGFNFVYSGNFAIDVEVDSLDCTRLLMGINPTDFRWKLEPGEVFYTPEAVMVYSGDGIGGMSRTFHKFYVNHLMKSEWAKKKRPLLINSWEAAFFDFDDEKLVTFAKSAKELGIEMLVMDDGWFGNRKDDHRALGDWQVNEDKLKGGLGSLIQRVNDLGVKFGIWYEPEMINEDSDLYRAHPDWCVHIPGREKSVTRFQLVLDMTRQDVRDHIWAQMHEVISGNNIEYIKWDCNRHITEAFGTQLPADRQGEFFHRYILGTYELMNRLTETFPHILLENCASGGGRFDAGMLHYSPQIWASDCTDPIERLTIQFGTSLCYPISAIGAHVSANSRAKIETRANVAMCGTFGYELDPVNAMTAEEKETVKQQVKDYHRFYDLIHSGDFYRLTAPTENAFLCEWEFVSADKNEALFTQVVMRMPDCRCRFVKLRGLDPEKYYEDTDTGEVYSGALLMHAGINLSWEHIFVADGSSTVKHFVAKA